MVLLLAGGFGGVASMSQADEEESRRTFFLLIRVRYLRGHHCRERPAAATVKIISH